MITILKDIPKGATTGNPMWIRAKTDAYQDLVNPSEATIQSQAFLADGEVIVIEFNGKRYQLTLKDNPDPKDPFQIPYDNSTNAVMAEHMTLIRCISEYYVITPVSGGFKMVAREIDAKWDVSFITSLSSGDMGATIVNADVTGPEKSFKGFLELFLQDDYTAVRDQSNPIGLLDADPHREVIDETLTTAEDLLDWEVQEALASRFDLKLPQLDGDSVVTGVLMNYWFKLFEHFGSPPSASLMQSFGGANDYYQVLLGGFAHHSWSSTELHTQYLKGATAASRKMLTNAPQGKRVGWSSHEWMSVYYDVPNNLTVRVQAFYNDGTSTTYSVIASMLDGSDIESTVACWGTGPTQIDLASQANPESIAYYEVWLWDEDDSNQLSEKFRYTLDHRSYLNEREIVFLGQLGNWDTARFIGQEVHTYENDGIEATRSRTPWNTNEKRYLKAKSKRDELISFTSGYQRDEEVEWLNELVLSEEVYIVKDGSLVPMYIEYKGGGSFGDAMADLHSGTFTGRIANRA